MRFFSSKRLRNSSTCKENFQVAREKTFNEKKIAFDNLNSFLLPYIGLEHVIMFFLCAQWLFQYGNVALIILVENCEVQEIWNKLMTLLHANRATHLMLLL
jgi:hypothetical protein